MDIVQIPNDIIIYMCEFLSDIDKVFFLSANNTHHLLKNKIRFNEKTHVDKINKLTYYNRFANVITKKNIKKLPLNITHLTLSGTYHKNINKLIPKTVTHLTFMRTPQYDISEFFPTNITHVNIKESMYYYKYPKTAPKCLVHEYEFDFNHMHDFSVDCIIGKNNSELQLLISRIIQSNSIKELLIIYELEQNRSFYELHYPTAVLVNAVNYNEKIIIDMISIIHGKNTRERKDIINRNRCIIFDHCYPLYSDSEVFGELLMNGRHYGIFTIISTTEYNMNPEMKLNFDYVYLLSGLDSKLLHKIWENYFTMIKNFDTFTKHYHNKIINNCENIGYNNRGDMFFYMKLKI